MPKFSLQIVLQIAPFFPGRHSQNPCYSLVTQRDGAGGVATMAGAVASHGSPKLASPGGGGGALPPSAMQCLGKRFAKQGNQDSWVENGKTIQINKVTLVNC